MNVVDIAVVIVVVVLALAALGTLYRIAAGPSLLDRVLAVDVLLAIVAAALAAEMAVHKHLDNLALLVTLSVIGFIGSVTVARYVSARKDEP